MGWLMAAHILRLYPGPPEDIPLRGTYLAHRLHTLGRRGAPFVYASFVSSLDGRIALRDPTTGISHFPPGLSSDNDFRLLLELLAQADCLVTHSGYLRDLAAGHLDDILQVGTHETARDLAQWRERNGLPAQPAVVVASASLDFPIPESLASTPRRMLVAVGRTAPAEKVARLRGDGYRVFTAGDGALVEGGALVRELGRLGFRSVYLLTGPRMLETMLRDRALSRLYVTMTHRLFGGEGAQTMIGGPELGDAGRLRMASLHYDATAPDGAGQWFSAFEPLPTEPLPTDGR